MSKKDLIDTSSQGTTSQIILTKDEKEKFLNALKENGLNVVYDLDKLSLYLPNRSKVELNYIVQNYNRKGHARVNDPDFQEFIQSISKSEDWFKIVHGSVPFSVKRSDLSNSLAKIISNISKDVPEPMETMDENGYNDEVNYKAIYEFMGQLFENKYPKGLEKRESLAMLSLVDNLMSMVEDLDTTSEEDFIRSSCWWKSEDGGNNVPKSSQQSSVDESSSSRHTIKGTDGSQIATGKPNQDKFSPNTSLQDGSFVGYSDLPKIRKIRECLNPLKVPINLLNQEHQTLSLFFE